MKKNIDILLKKKVYNKTLSPKKRAKALLKLMTVNEKVGQLNQRLYGFNSYVRNGEEISISEDFKAEVERFGGIGVLYGLYRADPWANKDENTGLTSAYVRKAYNMLQRYVIEHSRLHIPMMVSTECPHGHQALEGGLFPVNLALGATFDSKLVEKAYNACGKQLKEMNVDMALMSVLDILRDPRWGRSEECYSEDPFLASRFAFSSVSGMQDSGVISVAKHLCAQGQTTGGINASAAGISERELREIHLPVVEAVCRAKAGAVMAAYNEIDGVYCHANRKLLTDILRNEFGFEGVVMADGCAIDQLDRLTDDNVKSGAVALNAGVDISLWDNGFTKLEEAVKRGLTDMKTLDRAVLDVLTIKFERGLFDDPYIKEDPKSIEYYHIDEYSKKLALESAVLLKNEEDFLPLCKKVSNEKTGPDAPSVKKILITGPNADDVYRMLGDYTPPVNRDKAFTVLDGMRKNAPAGTEIVYSQGCGLFEKDEEELKKTVEIAKDCDAVVCVVGGSSSRFENVSFDINGAAKNDGKISMDCGEGRDVADIRLRECQNELIKAIRQVNKNVITVVISGRPLGIKEAVENSRAVFQCFYPGPYGGDAVSELIYGISEPSGRLNVTIPRDSGCLPVYYNSKDSYQPYTYSDEDTSVIYPFGYGLSYTKFEFSECRIELLNEEKNGSTHPLFFTVKNVGTRRGTAVPMLFLHHTGTETVQRRCELKAFLRVDLEPGEEKTIRVWLTEKAFMTYDQNLKLKKEEGYTEWFIKEGGKEVAKGRVLR